MYRQVIKRTGGALLAVGIFGGVVTITRLAAPRPFLGVASIAIAVGVFLLSGGPRAALWVRTLAVFSFAAGISALIAEPFYQPLDLTITQIRLDQSDFAIAAAVAVFLLGLLLWLMFELGRPPVQDAIASARIRRWGMRMPAQAGSGIVILVGLLLWLMLHGQTAALATSLAFQQLGPDYRYHLSWISNSNSDHGTSATGVVTAWNHKEIKTVLLHWETPR
jgi:hypothetical protein